MGTHLEDHLTLGLLAERVDPLDDEVILRSGNDAADRTPRTAPAFRAANRSATWSSGTDLRPKEFDGGDLEEHLALVHR